MRYSSKQIKDFLDGIFEGDITSRELPEDLYMAISGYLKAGLYEGFGGNLTKFAGKDLELLQELRENIYMFSAAKTFQEVKQISSFLVDESGNRRSFSDFNKLGEKEYDKWNKTYAQSEYNTAIAQATMASKWNGIQANKDLLPYLTYSTIGDACDICAPLDGMTAKVDDPIWSSVYPANHFNCMCIVTQEEDTVTPTPDDEKEAIVGAVTGEMDDMFLMNAGQDKYVFSPEHPYFQVEKKDMAFAKENYNLPIPEED